MVNTLFKRFISLPLRSQLFFMAFLLSLPAIVLIIYSGYEKRREAMTEAINSSKLLVNNIASEQYNLTGDVEQLLSVLALLPVIREKNVAATNKLLADILKRKQEYGNIIVSDYKGDVWASAIPSDKPISIKEARSFQQAVRTKKFSSGAYNIGKVSRKRTLGFCYPLLDAEGKVSDIVSVNFNFDKVNQLITKSGLPPGSSVTLIDYKGVIVSRNLNPEEFIGRQDKHELFQRIKNGPDEGTFIDTGMRGDKQIISYHQLRLSTETFPYMYIRVGIPLQVALLKTQINQFRNMAFMMLSFFAVIILVMLIAKYSFIERINKLQVASEHLAHGDLEFRVSEFVEGGELGRLGHAFDYMAKQLAQRELELQKSENEYRFLAENSADIIWKLGPDRRIAYINPADERLRGYSKDAVIGKTLTEFMNPEAAMRLDEINKHRRDQEQQGITTGLLRFETILSRKNGDTIYMEVLSSPIRDESGKIIGSHGVARDITARKKAEEEREQLILQLQNAMAEIKTLSGIIPICATCKKIRNDEGYWNQLEQYISEHSNAMFSHGICPDCLKIAYSEIEKMNVSRPS